MGSFFSLLFRVRVVWMDYCGVFYYGLACPRSLATVRDRGDFHSVRGVRAVDLLFHYWDSGPESITRKNEKKEKINFQ